MAGDFLRVCSRLRSRGAASIAGRPAAANRTARLWQGPFEIRATAPVAYCLHKRETKPRDEPLMT